jgi:HAD superfamily hydrolase (TIGR01484 family)
MPNFLVAMDIDDTQVKDRIIHPEISTEDELRLRELNQALHTLRKDGKAVVFHVTGGIFSDFTSFERYLPASDHLSCAAATELYTHINGRYVQDHKFQDALNALDFSEEHADDATQDLVEKQLFPLTGHHKSAFKISFIINPELSEQELKQVTNLVKERLQAFPDMNVTVVRTEKTNYLDITPRLCNKGDKVGFIAAQHGIDADNIIVFGNGENDISMFRNEFMGVAVQNAGSKLKDHVALTSQSGARHIITEAEYASGILEGLRYFGLV